MCTDAGGRERMLEVTEDFPAENRLRPRPMRELPETRAYERKASDPVFARKDCFRYCIFAGVIWPSFMHLACASHSSRPLDPIDDGRRRCDIQTKSALGIPAPFDYTEESPQDLKSVCNSICREFMKLVAVTFAVIVFLSCLGIGEEKAQYMGSPFHQLQLSQLISEVAVQPEPGKDGETSPATSNVRAALKLHRHRRAKFCANTRRTRREMDSGIVLGETRREPWFAFFPGPRYAPALQRRAATEDCGRRVESLDAPNGPSQSHWKWAFPWNNIRDPETGIDLQGLSVLNQSSGAQRSFYSLDLSANLVARNVNLWKNPLDNVCAHSATFSVLHEPALGLIASIHFRDPGDITNSPARTQGPTLHPLLTGQVDLLNLSFEHAPRECEYGWPEFKLTIAPQLDFYGRFTGKDTQFQWPLQPALEWHFSNYISAVFQVSIPLFTVGGRNPPPSFGTGIVWHAEGSLPWAPKTEAQNPCSP
jgi:hypothetical protein